MGKHSSSALTQTVAIDGLADSYMAFNTNYHDTGLFGVYGVTDRDRCGSPCCYRALCCCGALLLCPALRCEDSAHAAVSQMLRARCSTHGLR